MNKARLILSTILAVLAICAVTASSASAFSWWVGPTSKSSEELAEGAKLTFSSAATVKSPFTLKWFSSYEVRCEAATYDELFIEGRLGLGAKGIHLESCIVAKPAGYKVIGGQIDTSPLFGEIKPIGSKVEFTLTSTAGPFSAFVLENESKCTFNVTVQGTASGDLSAPSKLQQTKVLIFKSTGLGVEQTKNCGNIANKEKAKGQEEGKGQVESNKGKLTYSSAASFWSAH